MQGLLNDLRHDLLFELFAVLRCGHNTDFTSHVRLNLFFVTVHKTCSTPTITNTIGIPTDYIRWNYPAIWEDATRCFDIIENEDGVHVFER